MGGALNGRQRGREAEGGRGGREVRDGYVSSSLWNRSAGHIVTRHMPTAIITYIFHKKTPDSRLVASTKRRRATMHWSCSDKVIVHMYHVWESGRKRDHKHAEKTLRRSLVWNNRAVGPLILQFV